MLVDIGINLISGAIGFLLAQLYHYAKARFSRRAVTAFWVPGSARKIVLYCGTWEKVRSEIGELESVVNAQDALTLAELRLFLERYYTEVVITTDMNAIDWGSPVVSLGGPLPNPLTKEIGEQGLLPFWFRDLPYSKDSIRRLANDTRSESFTSELKEGHLISDVGFIAKLRYSKQRTHLYVIAGNYGFGNGGVVRHMTSAANIKQLLRVCEGQKFQAIIRSQVVQNGKVETRLLHCIDIN
jgi:hypothetical protein